MLPVMEKELDPALIQRVLEAMRQAAANNLPDSPDTAIEAMAKAAIKVIGTDDERR